MQGRFTIHINVRCFSTTTNKLGTTTSPRNARSKFSRQNQERFNFRVYKNLACLDYRYRIFDQSVRKVIDLGFAPGIWSKYTLNRLKHLHGPHAFENNHNHNAPCHILGFDLMFKQPPPGVSTIQGNIFSNIAHENIINHLKEVAWGKSILRHQSPTIPSRTSIIEPKSYITKEQEESIIDNQIEHSLNKLPANSHEYRADLVMSDLGAPFVQTDGYYSTTVSGPHIRFNNNEPFRQAVINPGKTSVELAEAALMVGCKCLKPDGRFLVRLPGVKPNDDRLGLFSTRLKKVFGVVKQYDSMYKKDPRDTIYFCKGKLPDDKYDIDDVFGL